MLSLPDWSRSAGRYVETVWPGIAEVQTTAARTGLWAGLDSPRFGPEVTKTFSGALKREGRWEEAEVTVTFPEWAQVTVYRLVNGVRCPFSEMVFWEEAYARQGKAELPNDMWQKRPKGQLLKCAKAASLRAAFPEEAGYTAEEMAGHVIEADGVPVQAQPRVSDAEAVTVPATKPQEGAQVAVADNATPIQGEAIPATAAEQEAAIDAQVRAQVAKLIERAAAVGAWGQAEDYLRSRFNGAHLDYALAALEKAAETAFGTARAA